MQQLNQAQLNQVFAALILKELGFQLGSQTTISSKLSTISPTGGTAFRDSFINGNLLILKLVELIANAGQLQNWNFVHVILTDGQDTDSKASLEDTMNIVQMLGDKVPVKLLKIILVGVGVSSKTENQLKAIAKKGGNNAEYYSASNADIAHIFQRLTASLGFPQRNEAVGVVSQDVALLAVKKSLQPVLQLSIQNYAVLLNLDVSGSMAGSKWNDLCASVKKFTDYLGNKDLIGAIVFNSDSKILSKLPQNDDLFKRSSLGRTMGGSFTQKIPIPEQNQKCGPCSKDCLIY